MWDGLIFLAIFAVTPCMRSMDWNRHYISTRSNQRNVTPCMRSMDWNANSIIGFGRDGVTPCMRSVDWNKLLTCKININRCHSVYAECGLKPMCSMMVKMADVMSLRVCGVWIETFCWQLFWLPTCVTPCMRSVDWNSDFLCGLLRWLLSLRVCGVWIETCRTEVEYKSRRCHSVYAECGLKL